MNNDPKETLIYGLQSGCTSGRTFIKLFQHPGYDLYRFFGGRQNRPLIRELLHKVGIQEPITSPTSNYMNLYINK